MAAIVIEGKVPNHTTLSINSDDDFDWINAEVVKWKEAIFILPRLYTEDNIRNKYTRQECD